MPEIAAPPPALRRARRPRPDAGRHHEQPRLPFGDEVVGAQAASAPAAEGVAGFAPTPAPEASPVLHVDCEALLRRLQVDPAPDRSLREMKWAVRAVGKVLRRPLRDIATDLVILAPLLAAATPASAGMSPAAWSRLRSRLSHALAYVGFEIVPGRDTAGLSAKWVAFRGSLPTQALKLGLSAFMSFCTREGIDPNEVTGAVVKRYGEALGTRSLKRKPQAAYRATVRYWNRAIACIPGLPQAIIPLETHAHFYSLPWGDFPVSFRTDVEAFLTNSGSQDEFDDDYVTPVKESVVNQRRRQTREMASMLVASGFDIERLTSLAVLVDPANVRASLKQLRLRIGPNAPSIGGKAWLVCVIARYWVKNREHADTLRDLARQLSHKQPGMTARNREQLRQFDLKANLNALLQLPQKVFAEAARQKLGSIAEARWVATALAVELLLVAPMRIGNLVGMEHERHLLTLGRGRDRNRHILLPGPETKTGKPFEMLLPSGSARLLDIYLATYRGRICVGASPFLFPNEEGARRSTIAFSRAIQLFVKRETGLQIHVHLFRQLAGKLHLDLHPNDIETVRLLFGHTSSSTTARYYTEQKTDQAYARYDGTISRLRSEADRPPPRPGRRPRHKPPEPVH